MLLSEILDSQYGKHETAVIYKIQNIVNRKVYIGQTRISLRKRILKHISDSRIYTKARKHYLHRAIIKYGLNNFSVEIIEHCDINNLNKREIYWISYYNSTDSKLGYNCTTGGEGCSNILVSEDVKKKLSYLHKQQWKNPEYREIQRKSRLHAYDYKFTKIIQLDFQLNPIKIWKSKKEVCQNFNGSVYGLSKNQKQIVRIGMYIFMELSYYNQFVKPAPKYVQLTLDYQFVNYFYSHTHANIVITSLLGRQYGKVQLDSITPRCSREGTKKAGYRWMTYENYCKYVLHK